MFLVPRLCLVTPIRRLCLQLLKQEVELLKNA
jgi:hypothetical protein